MKSLEKYHIALKEHAQGKGLKMSPDWEVVKPLLEGLLANGARYGYRTCPCRPAAGEFEKDKDIICPCAYALADVEEHGACYCWLFVADDWATGAQSPKPIPERRPPEKTLAI